MALTVGMLLAGTACAASPTTGDREQKPSSSSVPLPAGKLEGSKVKFYRSLRELAAESTLVLRVRIQGTRTDDLNLDTPWTLATVEALSSYKGETPRSALTVRQLGNTTWVPDDLPLLRTGQEYILFLSPFEWSAGKPSGEWVIQGAAGSYRFESTTTLVREDRASESLPERATLPDLLLRAGVG
jgi:hypothetical protein